MTEILTGIKVLKLYAWENPFSETIKQTRGKELSYMKTLAKVAAFTNFTYSCSPFIITLVVFVSYVFIDPVNNILTADKVFVSMALLNLMRVPLVLFPWALAGAIKIYVSVQRINKFLRADELDPDLVSQRVTNEENAVELRDAELTWAADDPDQESTLKNINLDVKKV